jgi:PAS domain S-box-containing protein
MTVNEPLREVAGTLAVSRSDALSSRRANRKRPPLLRGEASESFDETHLEVPVAKSERSEEVRVLVVDDNPELTSLTKDWLERLNSDFTVVCETNAVEALNHLESDDIECIISDYDMPNTNGIELLEITREQYPDLPFILYTGKGSEEVASDAIAAGVTDYMQKGGGADKYEVLANRVENAVEQYRTQQQFWDALTWYRRLVEQDLAGVFILQNGEFVYVNEYLADVFGYAQTELVGESPLVLADSPGDEQVLQTVVEIDGDVDDTFQYEFTAQRRDGETFAVEIQGGTVKYGGDVGVIAVLWDRGP